MVFKMFAPDCEYQLHFIFDLHVCQMIEFSAC